MNDEIRLPLDMLLIHDVDDLEEALFAKFAVEFECEIHFCKNKTDLDSLILEFGDDAKWYAIDTIENDRIRAVIDLLNMAENNKMLGHIIDRIVR
jgi:hypothetical protein